MKRFESVKFVPPGFVRDLNPITNNDLDALSVDILNKTSNTVFEKGGLEVISRELTKVTCGREFNFFETLYKVLVPLNDNITAETTSKVSVEGNGWERIRNSVVDCCMQFDSTVKLWDATRKDSTLYQRLPHTIYYEDKDDYYYKLINKGIPFTLKEARREYKKAIQHIHGDRAIPHLSDWNFKEKMRRRLTRILELTSHVNPKSAVYSANLSINVRHSLKTELLTNLETNTGNLGLLTAREDLKFADLIRNFQKPTEEQLPLSFTTCYKTSMYANCPTQIVPATMWDVRNEETIRKCAAVEFRFIIQNLVTAWTRRYDNLHLLSHQTTIKDLIQGDQLMENLRVYRSTSSTAKWVRNEIGLDDYKEDKWVGKRGFQEFKIADELKGLRKRKNACSE